MPGIGCRIRCHTAQHAPVGWWHPGCKVQVGPITQGLLTLESLAGLMVVLISPPVVRAANPGPPLNAYDEFCAKPPIGLQAHRCRYTTASWARDVTWSGATDAGTGGAPLLLRQEGANDERAGAGWVMPPTLGRLVLLVLALC